MRYVESRCKISDQDTAYRIYVTEALRGLANMNISYKDMIKPAVVETRSSEEIVTSISAKLSLLGGE